MYIHDDEKPSLVPYLIASVVLHVLLIIFFPYHIESPSWKEKVVEIIPVIEGKRPYEIVDIAKPSVETKPDKARFLGMYDSSVSQESVAISRKGGGAGGEGQRKREEGKRTKEEKLKAEKKGSLYSIDRKLFAKKEPDLGQDRDLQVGGSAALEDYYPDYKLGAHTYLNVLRYPEVEYFVRMKRQFKMTFDPVPALRDYFTNNRVTRGSVEVVLAVSVNREGNLSELFVLNSSGISSYDQEAMRTIRASAPFATPPAKFLEDDGLLRMSWTFTVYL